MNLIIIKLMNEQSGYSLKNINLFGLLLAMLFINPLTSSSQTSVYFNDTLINRGIISQIPIYGNISEANISNLDIILEFDAISLDIKSVSGSSDFIMKCPNPKYKLDMDNVSKSSMTISCNDIQAEKDGIFCILNLEGLAGPDSNTIIKAVKIMVNGQEVTNSVLNNGKITISGLPVYQTYPENIGNNYPNPFFEETRFPISIHEPTKVRFFIYTNDGRFILSNEEPNDMLKLSFYKNKTEIPISNLNEKLDKGFYILKLSPDNMRFASGEYYLIMITNLGVYHKNFLYFK
ncbi:MAG: hypothetical protein V1779_02590 [bacterium]